MKGRDLAALIARHRLQDVEFYTVVGADYKTVHLASIELGRTEDYVLIQGTRSIVRYPLDIEVTTL